MHILAVIEANVVKQSNKKVKLKRQGSHELQLIKVISVQQCSDILEVEAVLEPCGSAPQF